MRRLVALDLPGGPEFVAGLRRVLEAGDAALPIDQRLAGPARRRLLEELRPGSVLGADGVEVPLGGGRPVEDGDALVVATSGTTGQAKGVVLTHEAVEASARATSARLGVDPDRDRWLCCLPLAHVGGLSVVTRALATATPLEVLAAFDPEEVLAATRRRGATLVSLVPTALRRLGAPGAAGFRVVVLGGSTPPDDLPANVVTTYGMTETGSGLVYDGVPLEGAQVRIDEHGPGEGRFGQGGGGGGEILVRGPMLARGYRDGSALPGRDGWLATGDAGRIDGRGRLEVLGRLSDLIVTGGENVWPGPVEAVLARHPLVGEVAVAGRPDPEWGERVVAFVVPAGSGPAPALEELRDRVAAELGPWAAPKELVLVAALARTSIGKIARRRLACDPGLGLRG